MSHHRLAHAVRLEFAPDALVHANLSGAAFSGDWLWVAGDEACGVDRLQRLTPVGTEALRFGQGRSHALADLLDLPGAPDDEADLEGMAVVGDWLWVVGSHGHKRKNAKPGRSDADNARRLGKLALDGNRRLLARLPIESDEHGAPGLVRKARDGRRAALLKGDARDNELTRLLADDPHLAPFLAIPGKDNGFDIEGLAVNGDRLLLGLRGPVLRGWSLIIEIAVAERDGQLRLAPIDTDGTLLRKHFLPLDGLGVRDLHFSGEDLLILAGPTMVLDGDIRVFTWRGARAALANCEGPACFGPPLVADLSLPHGRGCDKAEALCALPASLWPGSPAWLVLYDAPGPERRAAEGTVWGDVLQRGPA